MARRTAPGTAETVETVHWRPPNAYPLALEVMSVAELRRRGSAEHFARVQRVEFFALMAVTGGMTAHTIDFVQARAGAGCWLLLRPGQVQRFDFSRRWRGRLLVFRPELLPPPERRQRSPLHALISELEGLPSVTRLQSAEHAVACALVEQMAADASLAAGVAERNALMLYQLGSLLMRLKLGQRRDERAAPAPAVDRDRVARLHALIESHFRGRHSVAWFAGELGCSAKTLTRAAQAVAGKTVKDLHTARITLEAKRLLVHSQQPMQTIADRLGFDEASNFVKFFKREAGCTPTVFRERQGAPASPA